MNTLTDNRVSTVLNDLHEKAIADGVLRSQARKAAMLKNTPFDHARATAYMAVSRDEGNLLYFLATVAKAKRIVEFGTSFGISTIYLAAAGRDNGGHVISAEIEPNKVIEANKNLTNAGLSDIVDIREGDAIQTLGAIAGDIDFLFLDGAKELYLPVFLLLRTKLIKGAIIVADNADKAEVRVFIDHILSLKSEFTTITLFEGRAFAAQVN